MYASRGAMLAMGFVLGVFVGVALMRTTPLSSAAIRPPPTDTDTDTRGRIKPRSITAASAAASPVPRESLREETQRYLLTSHSDPERYVGERRDAQQPMSEAYITFSTVAAVRDPRPVAMEYQAMRATGLGNVLFATSTVLANAFRHGFLPVVECGERVQNGLFGRLHCVSVTQVLALPETRTFHPSGHFISAVARDELVASAARRDNAVFLDYNQYPQEFAEREMAERVCWALQPQPARIRLLDQHLQHLVTWLAPLHAKHGEALRLAVVHVRRGDFLKARIHGTLTPDYYGLAWRQVQARVARAEPGSRGHVAVVVFCEESATAWVRGHLLDGRVFRGSAATTVFQPFSKQRWDQAEDVDLMAMAVGHYYIVANSTFSWWAHFFARCRRLLGWWTGRPLWPQWPAQARAQSQYFVFPPKFSISDFPSASDRVVSPEYGTAWGEPLLNLSFIRNPGKKNGRRSPQRPGPIDLDDPFFGLIPQAPPGQGSDDDDDGGDDDDDRGGNGNDGKAGRRRRGRGGAVQSQSRKPGAGRGRGSRRG